MTSYGQVLPRNEDACNFVKFSRRFRANSRRILRWQDHFRRIRCFGAGLDQSRPLRRHLGIARTRPGPGIGFQKVRFLKKNSMRLTAQKGLVLRTCARAHRPRKEVRKKGDETQPHENRQGCYGPPDDRGYERRHARRLESRSTSRHPGRA